MHHEYFIKKSNGMGKKSQLFAASEISVGHRYLFFAQPSIAIGSEARDCSNRREGEWKRRRLRARTEGARFSPCKYSWSARCARSKHIGAPTTEGSHQSRIILRSIWNLAVLGDTIVFLYEDTISLITRMLQAYCYCVHWYSLLCHKIILFIEFCIGSFYEQHLIVCSVKHIQSLVSAALESAWSLESDRQFFRDSGRSAVIAMGRPVIVE